MSEHLIWNELGVLHYNAGAYDQAIKAYNQALEFDEGFGLAIHNLALAYTQQGNAHEAIPLYEKCLELLESAHEKAFSWKHLGDAYRQLNEDEKALQAYQNAVDLVTEDVSLKGDLTSLIQELLHSGEAGQVIEQEPNEMESVPVNTDQAVSLADWGTEPEKQEPAPVSTLGEGLASPPPDPDSEAVQPDLEKISESESEPESNQEQLPDSLAEDTGFKPDEGVALSLPQELESQQEGLFMQVCIEQIYPNPHQPRTYIDATDLVDSVREYGIIQPLIVARTESPDKFILVSGERRLDAARQVGLDKVPVFIREVCDQQLLELALIENVNRSNLSVRDQAKAMEKLNEEYSLPQDAIAVRVGKSRVSVANSIRLARLPEHIMHAIDTRRITEAHAHALLNLPSIEFQVYVLRQIMDGDLTVRQTEAMVRKVLTDAQGLVNAETSELEQPVAETSPSEDEVILEADLLPAPEVADVAIDEEVCESIPVNDVEIENIVTSDESLPDTDTEAIPAQFIATEEQLDNEDAKDTFDETYENPQDASIQENEQEESLEEKTAVEFELHLPPVQESSQDNDRGVETLSEENIRSSSITYKKVTELNPRNDKAWEMLGGLYVSLKEYNNAIHAFEQAVAIDPRNEEYHYQLGQVYALQRMYENAIKEFQQAIDLNAENVYAYCALASSYRHMGQDEEAQEYLDLVAPKMQNEKPYNNACFESIRGNVDEAIALLKEALDSKQVAAEQVRLDPDLDFIRDTPQYVDLLEKDVLVT